MNSSTSNFKGYLNGYATVLLIGVIGFCAGSEFLVRTVYAPKNSFDDIRAGLYASNAAYGAFADSRGANGLKSSPNFENFSTAGDNLNTILAKAQIFSARPGVTGIVLQADPHHFASYRLERDQSAIQQDLIDNEQHLIQFLRPVYRQYILSYWSASLKELFMGSPKHSEAGGHSLSKIVRLTDLSEAVVKQKTSIRAGQQIPIDSFERAKFAPQYKMAVDEFLRQGLKVCLVTFPVSETYRTYSNGEATYQKAKDFYAGLGRTTSAKYVDLSAIFSDALFSDPDHLNVEGAEKLTDIVYSSCFGTAQ
ncbi:hypothetical protein V5T82_08980 [Magnetovibrio sp. PR-2]|uniref:hypothetical protein n=1 Tax=Magnetovibrio sp. PR-2 TaxID=3120356 RepID=UPI002FCDECC7